MIETAVENTRHRDEMWRETDYQLPPPHNRNNMAAATEETKENLDENLHGANTALLDHLGLHDDYETVLAECYYEALLHDLMTQKRDAHALLNTSSQKHCCGCAKTMRVGEKAKNDRTARILYEYQGWRIFLPSSRNTTEKETRASNRDCQEDGNEDPCYFHPSKDDPANEDATDMTQQHYQDERMKRETNEPIEKETTMLNDGFCPDNKAKVGEDEPLPFLPPNKDPANGNDMTDNAQENQDEQMTSDAGVPVREITIPHGFSRNENGKAKSLHPANDGRPSQGFRQIFVENSARKAIALNITPLDTVSNIKAQIEDKQGIPSKNQHLTFRGHELHTDSAPLNDYDIQPGSILYLHAPPNKMRLAVKLMRGKTISMRVNKLNTISDIKAMIHKQEGIQPEQQRLIFDGKRLQDNKTLHDYGIRYAGATLHLVVRHNSSR